MPVSGMPATAICCGTSRTPSAPKARPNRIHWDARAGCPQKRFLTGERYYLPYLGFRSVGEWFDSFGNLLAILAGVADRQQTGIILDFIARHSMDTWPVRSLTPVVRPGDPDWRDYYSTLNVPHHYHNGGVWPFLGGFYVAALVKAGRSDAAAAALLRLGRIEQSRAVQRVAPWRNRRTNGRRRSGVVRRNVLVRLRMRQARPGGAALTCAAEFRDS